MAEDKVFTGIDYGNGKDIGVVVEGVQENGVFTITKVIQLTKCWKCKTDSVYAGYCKNPSCTEYKGTNG